MGGIARARVRSKSPVGGGITDEPRIFYRDEQPEIILPILANPNAYPTGAGAIWTYDAWLDIVTAAQMTADYEIVGIQPNLALIITRTTTGTTGLVRMAQYQIGQQVGGVDTMFAHMPASVTGSLQAIAFPAGPVAVARLFSVQRLYNTPFSIASGVALRARVALSDAGTMVSDGYALAIPSGGYVYQSVPTANLVVPDIVEPNANETALTSGGAAWTFGAWTALPNLNPAAQDYLCSEIALNPASGRNYQVEIRRNDGAANPILARAAVATTQLAAIGNVAHFDATPGLPPFRINAGDTIEARCASNVAASVVDIQLGLSEVSGW